MVILFKSNTFDNFDSISFELLVNINVLIENITTTVEMAGPATPIILNKIIFKIRLAIKDEHE